MIRNNMDVMKIMHMYAVSRTLPASSSMTRAGTMSDEMGRSGLGGLLGLVLPSTIIGTTTITAVKPRIMTTIATTKPRTHVSSVEDVLLRACI